MHEGRQEETLVYSVRQETVDRVAEASPGSAPESSEPLQQTRGDRWVEVLVDCPGAQGLFTYAVPSELKIQAGDILTVPFGPQQVGAIAIALLNQLPPDLDAQKVRPIEAVVSRSFFPAGYWELLHRVANYYCTPLLSVIRVALPPGLLGRSQRRVRCLVNPSAVNPAILSPAALQVWQVLQASKTQDYSWQHLQKQFQGGNSGGRSRLSIQRGLQELIRHGWVESYLEPPKPSRPKLRQAISLASEIIPGEPELSDRQREILQVLRRYGGELWVTELLQHTHTSSSTLKTLEKKGYVVIEPREMLRATTQTGAPTDTPKALTPHQVQAVNALTGLSGYQRVLLHGVTGSGKTEVYLQAIAPVLQRGQSALVLVPEIGLTPQLTDRFRARFGAKVCVYHSALSDGERYDTWRHMISGQPQVAIGTRSAIFAPLPRLGLIILDEEHDSSFKQDSPAPCYHARTVAQWRAQLVNCPLILGSATPCLESWVSHREGVKSDHTHYLALPTRIHARPMPQVTVVDMRQELKQGNRSLFSRALQTELEQLSDRGSQGILFIHRRGHSTFVSCRSCGYVMDCPNCDVSLSYHYVQGNGQPLLRCHYCNHAEIQPKVCPECSSPYLKFFGSGTQRVVQELAREFPHLRCIRFDSDTTRTKDAHRTLLNQFAAGEAELLVGTQMLTKGIDLPQVTVVGIMAADGLLHMADFRAGERALQTLTQVAGRAGRGTEPGQVILQTYTPHHPVIAAVKDHAYDAFIGTELQQRTELAYPPYGQLVLLRLSSPEATDVQETAEAIAQFLQDKLPPGCVLLGPSPAQVFRVARRYRWQILLKRSLHSPDPLPDLTSLRTLCSPSVHLTIDVDPLNLS